MKLREETGRYLVITEEKNEDEVLEFTSLLRTELRVKTNLEGATFLDSSCTIPKDYELKNGTRLIKDKSGFYDPLTNHTFTIKYYEVVA